MTTVPKHADLRKLAAAGASLKGTVALGELARIAGLLSSTEGCVSVSLRLGQDDEGYRFLTGTVAAAAGMQCQRCLGEVIIEIDAQVNLAMVWREDEIPSLPSRFEGLVVGTESIDLHELIEEELLLALPLVPRHPEGQCRMASGEEPVAEATAARSNPFAVALKGSTGK